VSGRLQLVAGETLAHYQVEAKLGEGGMGTVYRAFDTRLHRKVALMVLALERFSDMERKLRLMREARAASALDHPNIANEDRERGSATAGRIGRDTRGPRKGILRCLRKDPARRYQTMSDLKEALEDIEAETSGIVKNRREAPVSATG